MRKALVILLGWILVFPTFSGYIGEEKEELIAEDIAEEIRKEFWLAWKGYKEYAWG
jgi:hypothetical protein